MAHADYDCCAVCDRKMSYAIEASTKELICSRCVADLALQGVIVHDVEELMSWIGSDDPGRVVEILDAVGYRRCLYPNPVDDLVATVRSSCQP